jgi:peptidoglycan/LPS O-acetylase OafA/YrhL
MKAAWRVHRWWFTRAALVLLVTVLIEAAVGGFVAKPFPWIALVAGSLPFTLFVFVALPLVKKEERT